MDTSHNVIQTRFTSLPSLSFPYFNFYTEPISTTFPSTQPRSASGLQEIVKDFIPKFQNSDVFSG